VLAPLLQEGAAGHVRAEGDAIGVKGQVGMCNAGLSRSVKFLDSRHLPIT
jgi:hypothetical protein